MKAAKAPPTAEQVGEAEAIVDQLLHAQEIGDGTIAPHTHGLEIFNMAQRVFTGAIHEYLRVFPRSRNSGFTYSKIPIDHEWHFTCLFCRASINTLSTETRARPPAVFYTKINAHSNLCAARFLAGQIEAIGPKGERATVPAIAHLKGITLIRAAKEAAIYLGVQMPTVSRRRGSRTGISKGRATELRELVARARRAADLVAKNRQPLTTTDTDNDTKPTTGERT